MKRANFKLFSLTIFLLLFFFSPFAFAQFNVFVSPPVIEEKARSGDVLESKIKIKNLGNTLYHFYTLVEDIGEKTNLDKSISLAKWIEIFRGRTEIAPGQEKEIPLFVRIPSYAKPGSYFAQIIFAQGSTESDARERAKTLNMPKVLLNISVEENIVEKIQVKKFQTEKNFYFSPNVKFKIELENIGNVEIEPETRVIIYGKRGEEIAEIKLEKQKILAGEKKEYEVLWKANKIGQFKAVLFGEYGKNKEKIFQDTTYFWIFSWQYLVLIFFIFLVLIFLLSWIFSKSLRKQYIEFFRSKKVLDVFKK